MYAAAACEPRNQQQRRSRKAEQPGRNQTSTAGLWAAAEPQVNQVVVQPNPPGKPLNAAFQLQRFRIRRTHNEGRLTRPQQAQRAHERGC